MPQQSEGPIRWLSQNFIWLLLASYGIAIVFPGPGDWVREFTVFRSDLLPVKVTIPFLLLSVLFFHIGIDLARHGKHSQASAGSIGLVVAGGWVIPVLLLFITHVLFGGSLTGSANEVYLGLVLVAAMPIANSSSAWAQNLGADVGHSVVSLIWSTLLAPIVSVLIVTLLWPDGSAAGDLKQTMSVQIVAGLVGCVVLPIAVGAGLVKMRHLSQQESITDATKFLNMTILLILNYSNAAKAMPQAFREGRFLQIALALSCVAALCGCLLVSARLLSRWRKWSMPLSKSAALSMSMKNTGTALVIAGGVLPDGSMAILVIVGYTLVQHMFVSVIGPVNVDAEMRPVAPAVLERLRQDSEPPLLTASSLR